MIEGWPQVIGGAEVMPDHPGIEWMCQGCLAMYPVTATGDTFAIAAHGCPGDTRPARYPYRFTGALMPVVS